VQCGARIRCGAMLASVSPLTPAVGWGDDANSTPLEVRTPASEPAFTNPVIEADFPDPELIVAPDGTYCSRAEVARVWVMRF